MGQARRRKREPEERERLTSKQLFTGHARAFPRRRRSPRKWPLALPAGRAAPDMPDALCVRRRGGLPASAWDEGADDADRKAAQAICGRCAELEACRAWGIEWGGPHLGVIGGLVRTEREAIRRAAWEAATLGVVGQVSA